MINSVLLVMKLDLFHICVSIQVKFTPYRSDRVLPFPRNSCIVGLVIEQNFNEK